jgi:hypothetical protein
VIQIVSEIPSILICIKEGDMSKILSILSELYTISGALFYNSCHFFQSLTNFYHFEN